MLIAACILLLFVLIVALFMRQEKFGRAPSGQRLQKIKRSPNYKNTGFHNAEHTPSLTEGASYAKVMRDFFFTKNPNREPPQLLPTIKTDLHQLDRTKNLMVWFGHSSYFLQIDGLRVLVDPVLSGAASPVSFTTRSFEGADSYKPADIPEIDVLIITHDHWDHLDHSTIKTLKPKIKKVITSLGVGAHLERWGIDASTIIELDWNEDSEIDNGFTINSITARHFSGRGFKRGQSIWSSFVLTTPSKRIFIGGDSGYGKHFEETGKKFGPFDLAILECGQYNANWKYIHMMPEETAKAANDLKAKKFIAVHWAKFALAMHDWDESIRRVQAAAKHYPAQLLHPMIGEAIYLDTTPVFENWWEKVK